MAVMNLDRTVPTRFRPQEHHTTKTDLIQSISIPTPKGTGHSPPIKIPDMGDISAGHSPAVIPTMTEAAVSEGTPHALHSATVAAHAALKLMDTTITTCTMTPTGIVTSHPVTCHFSCRCHSCHSTDLSWSCSSNSTTMHRKHSQEKPSNAQDLQPPINPTVPRLTIQDSPSDSSSVSDSDSDPLNH